ncbi:DNA-binding protein [Oceanobacillus piezotolerans]|uniref:DNA-binding protein n=1 Tax=Oceanobacillus piezotolerans TaxID=2448030 RepID=A0A498DHC2_9BACI|nr:DNA-binding protein [Oceanobacillus piezotolerans]RLL44885.1 DNA-binding protein [Oceanobacillus piezotolerans]
MEFDFFWLAIGIAAAGYFIGEGIKNFNNPDGKDLLGDSYDDDQHELIKDKDVHHFMGISKEDAKLLVEKYPDIPHIELNGSIYYPKAKLRQWLMKIGE